MFLSSWKYEPGCSSRIRILNFYPSRIPDPGVKKAPDPQHWFSVQTGNRGRFRFQGDDEGGDEVPEKKVVFEDDEAVEDIDLETFGKKKKKKKKREGMDMEELKVTAH
jgi:hypothetical protein